MPLIEDLPTDRSHICRCPTRHVYSPEFREWVLQYCSQRATHTVEDSEDYEGNIYSSERLRLSGENSTVLRVCELHYIQSCSYCGNEAVRDQQTEDARRSLRDDICNDCIEEHCRVCDRCNDWMESEDSYWAEGWDECLCSVCYEDYISQEDEDSEDDGGHHAIHGYSYKANPSFKVDIDKDRMISTRNISRRTYLPVSSYFLDNIVTFDDEVRRNLPSGRSEEQIKLFYENTIEGFRQFGHQWEWFLFLSASPNLFLGLELEIEIIDDNRYDQIIDHIHNEWGEGSKSNLLYMKRDGSLSSSGVELVFHPMTLSAFKKFVPKDMFTYLRMNKCRSWDTDSCGMHIHSSKLGFDGQSHQYKFAQFINNNKDNNYQIAGRNSSWAKYPGSKNEYRDVIKYIKRENEPSDRYMAVNLMPEKTIELRIFRGSLKYERIMGALEYVDAVAQYTRNISIPQIIDKGKDVWSWQPFKEFVANNIATYSNLAGYLNVSSDISDKIKQIEKEKVN